MVIERNSRLVTIVLRGLSYFFKSLALIVICSRINANEKIFLINIIFSAPFVNGLLGFEIMARAQFLTIKNKKIGLRVFSYSNTLTIYIYLTFYFVTEVILFFVTEKLGLSTFIYMFILSEHLFQNTARISNVINKINLISIALLLRAAFLLLILIIFNIDKISTYLFLYAILNYFFIFYISQSKIFKGNIIATKIAKEYVIKIVHVYFKNMLSLLIYRFYFVTERFFASFLAMSDKSTYSLLLLLFSPINTFTEISSLIYLQKEARESPKQYFTKAVREIKLYIPVILFITLFISLVYYNLVSYNYFEDAIYDIYFIILMSIAVISNYLSNILGIYLHINKTDNTLFITALVLIITFCFIAIFLYSLNSFSLINLLFSIVFSFILFMTARFVVFKKLI